MTTENEVENSNETIEDDANNNLIAETENDDNQELKTFVEIQGIEQESEDNAGDDEQSAPAWVREVRKQNREAKKRIKELESQLEKSNPSKDAPELGKKPKLEDFDYDEEDFDNALDVWYQKKREVEAYEEKKKEANESEAKNWQKRLDAYAEKRSELSVDDFEEAESEVTSQFNQTQQGIIVQGADNPALLVYAIGKNTNLRNKLSEISDPVKFAFAVAKLEKDLRVSKRERAKPNPERRLPTGGGSSTNSEAHLNKLREQATKTGDFSKVVAYRRKLNNQ